MFLGNLYKKILKLQSEHTVEYMDTIDCPTLQLHVSVPIQQLIKFLKQQLSGLTVASYLYSKSQMAVTAST